MPALLLCGPGVPADLGGKGPWAGPRACDHLPMRACGYPFDGLLGPR